MEIIMPVRPKDTLCLLNELSAAWFTAGWDKEPNDKHHLPDGKGWI